MDYITYLAGKHKLSHDIKKDSKLKIKYHAFSYQNPLAKEVRIWMFHKWKAVWISWWSWWFHFTRIVLGIARIRNHINWNCLQFFIPQKTSHLQILLGGLCRSNRAPLSFHKDQDQKNVHSAEWRYISELSIADDWVRHKFFGSNPYGKKVWGIQSPDQIKTNGHWT